MKKFFKIDNESSESHKILTILGIKFKFKKKISGVNLNPCFDKIINPESNNNKILLITHTNFLKRDAGNNEYIYTIVKILNGMGFSIDFLSSDKFLKNDFDNFENLNLHEKLINKFYLSKPGECRKYIYSSGSWCDDNLVKLFKKITNDNNYSYILLNYMNFTDLCRLTKLDKNTKIINVLHDCNTMQSFFGNNCFSDDCNSNAYNNLGNNFETEIKLLTYYHNVLCISNDEKYLFSKFSNNTKYHWLPMVASPKYLTNNIEDRDIDCLFIGHSNPYNLKSIVWFYDNVYKLINSNIHVTVCGYVTDMLRNQLPEKYNEMQNDGFEFIDFALNLDDVYKRTKIAIVPMLDGTGLKIKTVTAMSYGIPIVGTSAAVDGFPDKTLNGCLISDVPQVFADYIIKLLNDKDYYSIVTKQSKHYFEQMFTEKNAITTLKNVFINNEFQ